MDRQKVEAIGGVALFADHADTLAQWYGKHLGINFTREPDSHEWWCNLPGAAFSIRPSNHAVGHERRQVEITWRVASLDDFVESLADLGVTVDERQETSYGGFAWFDDPEGNRIGLWQEAEQ